jgi:hypothetical protein
LLAQAEIYMAQLKFEGSSKRERINYRIASSSPKEVEVGPTVTLANLAGGSGSRGRLFLGHPPVHSTRSKQVQLFETRRRFGGAISAGVGARHAV